MMHLRNVNRPLEEAPAKRVGLKDQANRSWKHPLLFAFGLLVVASATAQPLADLRTRPERTDYVETSRYADVMAFVEAVTDASPRLHLTRYGYTIEGREMPLVVAGDVADASPEAIRATGKLRVLVQGNIHAGEVEGKEAVLEILRSIAQGEHADWFDDLVILFTPIYNADGNERVNLYNRPYQHGPTGGMGQRPNAQGFDLNRDHMKLASSEARNFARLLTDYDPQVTLDLHTSDGSFHGYHLTYSPPLNPDTDPAIVAFLRGELLPAVARTMRADGGWESYHYGNFDGFEQRPKADSPGWYTFDHRPRFNNSYVGLRNRVAILSEAYAYITFEDRIAVTRAFVEEILTYAADHTDEIVALTRAADARSIVGTPMAVRSTFAPPDTTTILVGDVTRERNPFSGAPMFLRTDDVTPRAMLDFTTFAASETTVAPAAYLIPESETRVLENLAFHGIQTTPAQVGDQRVEVFAIDSVRVSPRAFQGVNEQEVFGSYRAEERAIPENTLRVDVAGPLARLIVYLLEPRSDDGLVDWGFFGDTLKAGGTYPIWRVPQRGN